MSHYSGIREIKVLSDPDAVNELLDDFWELLEFYKAECGIMFVLGRNFSESFRDFLSNYAREGTE